MVSAPSFSAGLLEQEWLGLTTTHSRIQTSDLKAANSVLNFTFPNMLAREYFSFQSEEELPANNDEFRKKKPINTLATNNFIITSLF